MWNHGMGAGFFWLFIAAAVVAGAWEKIRRNAEKHETLRRIIEKTGRVDEAALKELFNPATTSSWGTTTAGDGYRGLRIGGTVVMAIALGAAIFFLAMRSGEVISRDASIIGLAASAAVAVLGIALFYSSRFAEPPAGSRTEPPAR